MAAKAAGMPIEDNGKEDVFELQHHHLLRCLEKTTKMKASLKPNDQWGPKDSSIREEWQNQTKETKGFWKTNIDWLKSKLQKRDISPKENIALENQD